MSFFVIIIAFTVFGIILFLIKVANSKRKYEISREIIINKTIGEVFNYIKLLKNSENYSKWVMEDPNLKKEYQGIDGEVNFVYSWDSKFRNVGKGEQKIIAIFDGERIDYKINFQKPMKSISYAWITTDYVGDAQTRVTWTFTSENNFIMKLMNHLLNLDKILGEDLQEGLNNLKNILEKY